MKTSVVTSIALIAWSGVAYAADSMPLKAPAAPAAAPAWSGFYLGGNFGYAAGQSDWTARGVDAAVPPVSGSLSLFDGYDAFKGTGSFFGGLQAGYNHLLPSRVLLGVEADISFPNMISGSRTMTSPAIGQASYTDTSQLSGTLRGRFGYAFDHWLLFGTAGFAWSYDAFSRTQLAGTPLGGTAGPGTEESAFKVRAGWAAGVGVEVPVAPNWTARAEYLFSDFGTRGVTFPAAAQRVELGPRAAQPAARLELSLRSRQTGRVRPAVRAGNRSLGVSRADHLRAPIRAAIHVALSRSQ